MVGDSFATSFSALCRRILAWWTEAAQTAAGPESGPPPIRARSRPFCRAWFRAFSLPKRPRSRPRRLPSCRYQDGAEDLSSFPSRPQRRRESLGLLTCHDHDRLVPFDYAGKLTTGGGGGENPDPFAVRLKQQLKPWRGVEAASGPARRPRSSHLAPLAITKTVIYQNTRSAAPAGPMEF